MLSVLWITYDFKLCYLRKGEVVGNMREANFLHIKEVIKEFPISTLILKTLYNLYLVMFSVYCKCIYTSSNTSIPLELILLFE